MNKELIMKSDVLDILFENRNKTYGAYTLRKFYADRLRKALGIMMIVAIVFSAATLFTKKVTLVSTRDYIFNDPELKQVADKPKEEVKKQETAKPQPKAATADQGKMVSNPVIVPNTAKADTIQTLKDTDVIGSTTTPGTGPAIVQPVQTVSTETNEAPAPKIDKTIPMDLNSVDVLPSYPGGMDALRRFLQKNLNNPKDMEEGESVNVRIRFVVGYNGKLQSFVTVEDGGEEFNKEVVRVLKKMPDWIPGKAKGENVSVYYIIPVKFTGAD